MKYHQLTRLFIKDSLKQTMIELRGLTDVHYLTNVMRKKTGQQLLIFNSQDGEYLGEILAVSSKQVSIKLIEQIRAPEIETELNLVFAPIKQTRIGFLLEKATELGATRLIPVQTQHSVVDKVNLAKWQIYVKEAAEQCGRLSIPIIEPLQSLDKFLAAWPIDKQIIFCNEQEKVLALKEYKTDASTVLIGPEGGFSAHEISLLKAKSYIISVHLGKRILRAETAALTALTLIG